jgi:hypothetical protein
MYFLSLLKVLVLLVWINLAEEYRYVLPSNSTRSSGRARKFGGVPHLSPFATSPRYPRFMSSATPWGFDFAIPSIVREVLLCVQIQFRLSLILACCHGRVNEDL